MNVLKVPVQPLWWDMIYRPAKPFVQKDMGLFNTLIYHSGAPVDGALFNQNYITVGQLITSI